MLAGISICIAVVNMTSCSNTKKQTKPVIKAKPVKHHVSSDTKQKQQYANLLDLWEKQGLVQPSNKQKLDNASIKPTNKKVSLKSTKKVSTKATKQSVVYEKRRPTIRKNIAKQNTARKPASKSYRAPSHRAPVKNIRYASLSGDYVSNQQTHAFINKMVSKHGFDHGYLNYLFSTEIKALIDRAGLVAIANGHMFKRKVGAAVVAVRRAGSVSVFDAINYFFFINQLIVPGSIYWNMGIGYEKGDVKKDEEGIQTMKVLGENMAWLLKKLHG